MPYWEEGEAGGGDLARRERGREMRSCETTRRLLSAGECAAVFCRSGGDSRRSVGIDLAFLSTPGVDGNGGLGSIKTLFQLSHFFLRRSSFRRDCSEAARAAVARCTGDEKTEEDVYDWVERVEVWLSGRSCESVETDGWRNW